MYDLGETPTKKELFPIPSRNCVEKHFGKEKRGNTQKNGKIRRLDATIAGKGERGRASVKLFLNGEAYK